MANIPIKEKTFATANGLMAVPTNNNNVDNYTTLLSLADDYLKNSKGFLTGSNTLDYYQSQNTQGYKWQISQDPVALDVTGGTNLSANLEQNLNFFVQPSTSVLTMIDPTNGQSQTPAGYPFSPTYFRVYARNASANSAGYIVFNSNWTPIDGSNQYSRTGGNTGLNIIHCYWSAAVGKGWYKIENVDGGVMDADITVTSANLLANQSNILVAAPGADKFIEVLGRVFVRNGTGSAAYSTVGTFIVSGDIKSFFAEVMLDFFPEDQYFTNQAVGTPTTSNICQANQSLVLYSVASLPTDGDYDVRLKFKYRIIDLLQV